MCEFCKEWKGKDTICGSDIPIYYCGHKDSTLTQAQILKNCADDRPGIVIYSGCKAMGYFDIKFCPMCGRKLVKGVSVWSAKTQLRNLKKE